MENSRNATTIRFWAFSLLVWFTLLAATLSASVAEAKPASVLLQEGLYAEEIEGNLDSAIKIYEQVIAEAQPAQQTAAQAMYRLGMCYLKKGERDKAAERFREVLSKFPEQGALAAKAQEQLAKLKPPVAARDLTFGPERFEKLYDIDHETTKDKVRAIDFDQGRLLKIPTYSDDPDNKELMKWLAENGVDAVAEITEEIGGLIAFGMAVVPVEPLWWPGIGPAPEQVSSVPLAALPAPTETTPMLLGDSPHGQRIFAFRTREGGVGILQVLDADKKPQHVEFRYKMLQEPPTTPIGYVFGPVIERVINDDGEETNWLIDFDTGKLFSHSTDIDSEEKFFKWVAENGIDAMGESRASSPGLYGFDMAVIPLANARWEGISTKRLREELSITKPGTPAVMSAKGDLPATFMVKTREGGMGVVQITEMITNVRPRHFKIRYKMLQEKPRTVAGPAEPLPVDELVRSGRVPRFRAVIYDNTALDLETGVAMALKDRCPEEFDVGWDNDGGGALMVNPASGARIVALTAAKKERWEQAITMARNALGVLRAGTGKGIFAGQTSFAAVLTDQGNLAIVGIGDYDPEKATLYWWLEKIPERKTRTVFLPDSDTAGANVVLDLASEELLPPGKDGMLHGVFGLLGKGDLAYDGLFRGGKGGEFQYRHGLICIRDAKAIIWKKDGFAELETVQQLEDTTTYLLPTFPCRLLVTTAKGDNYEVTVKSAEGGINLEYKRSVVSEKDRLAAENLAANGWLLLRQGELGEAEKVFRRAALRDPTNAEALNGLATTCMRSEKYNEAAKYYKVWLRIEPDNADAKAGLEKAKAAAGR